MAPRKLAALDDGVAQPLVDEDLRKVHEHHRQCHEPEVSRPEKVGENDEDDKAEQLPAPVVDDGPCQPTGDALAQRGSLGIAVARLPGGHRTVWLVRHAVPSVAAGRTGR